MMIVRTLGRIRRVVLRLVTSREGFARRLGVSMGADCRIYIREWGTEPFLISIGDQVTITAGVKFLTHDGSTWLFHNEDGVRFQHYAPIFVGSQVFIGSGSVILPGVTIGSQCVIAAGSVVTKDIPDGSVAAGNPARIISTFDELRAKVMSKYVNEEELLAAPCYRARVEKAVKLEGLRSGKAK